MLSVSLISIQNTLSKHIHIDSSLLKYFCKSYLPIPPSDLPIGRRPGRNELVAQICDHQGLFAKAV